MPPVIKITIDYQLKKSKKCSILYAGYRRKNDFGDRVGWGEVVVG